MRFKISTKEKTLSYNNNYNKIYRTIRENKDKFNSKFLYLNSIKISSQMKEPLKNKFFHNNIISKLKTIFNKFRTSLKLFRVTNKDS